MPPLKNLKHELFARNLVKTKFNQTKAYDLTYPDSSYEAARFNGSRITNENITTRALEILDRKDCTSLEGLLKSLEDDLTAKRIVVIKGKAKQYRDNNTILETKKFLLNKVYGLNGIQDKVVDVRNVNVVLNEIKTQELSNSVDKLTKLHERMELKAIKVV